MKVIPLVLVLGLLVVSVTAKGKSKGKEDDYEPVPDPEADKLEKKEKGDLPEEEAETKPRLEEGEAIPVPELKEVISNVTAEMKKPLPGKTKFRTGGGSVKRRRRTWTKRFKSTGKRSISSRVTFCSTRVKHSFSSSVQVSTNFHMKNIWHGVGGIIGGGLQMAGGKVQLAGGLVGGLLNFAGNLAGNGLKLAGGVASGITGFIGGGVQLAGRWVNELDRALQMTCFVRSGRTNYNYKVYFGKAPGSDERYLYWCRQARGRRWCSMNGRHKWNRVSIADLDRDLKFGLVTWEHQDYPLFGLVGSPELSIPGEIYGFGAAAQMPFVINRLYTHFLIKRDVILKGLKVRRYRMVWQGQQYRNSPSKVVDRRTDLIWDIPYWLPPKNRVNCWKLYTNPETNYPVVSYTGNTNPAPITCPGLLGINIRVTAGIDFPKLWTTLFDVKRLVFHKMPRLEDVVCLIPLACRRNDPDIISVWNSNTWCNRCSFSKVQF